MYYSTNIFILRTRNTRKPKKYWCKTAIVSEGCGVSSIGRHFVCVILAGCILALITVSQQYRRSIYRVQQKKLKSTLKHCISYTFGVERKQICGNKDNQVK